MDKALRNTLIAGIIIVSVSIGYYLVIFLPGKEATKLEQQNQEKIAEELKEVEKQVKIKDVELLAKKEKCFADAKKFHTDYTKSEIGYYFEPKYNYNARIERCLYSGGTTYLGKSNIWNREIKDVYTNETVLSVVSGSTKEQLDAFWKAHNELMTN